MRGFVLLIAIAMVVVACGGDESGAGSESDDGSATAAEVPDPCELVDQTILDSYFTEDVEPESGEVGPLVTCKWSDSNANSVLIQVAANHPVTRPDPCDGCANLPFADDGYASGSPIQSSATFVVGSTFFSVSTTGLGDDTASIAALAESVYEASK